MFRLTGILIEADVCAALAYASYNAKAKLPLACLKHSLYILYLLAHLLNQHFKLNGYLRHFLVG